MYLMNSVFMPELDKFVVVFIDDILIIYVSFFNDYGIIVYMPNSLNMSSGLIV
jgi:hypothetical protein